MNTKALLTHEIGSLAKPNWRVKALRNRPLTHDDIEYAKKWANLLDIDISPLLEILNKRIGFTPEEKNEIVRYSSLIATKMLEKTGIDLIYDGEQHRIEMYEYPIKHIDGFKFVGHIRSFDNKYYRSAAVISEPKLRKPYHVDEYTTISSFTHKPVKIPITGPYTLVDWSFDEYYSRDIVIGFKETRSRLKDARRTFLRDIAENIIHPNIEAIYNLGARFIQIDEPAATTKREEIPEFFEALETAVGDLKGKAFFSVHICFSEYHRLFPLIEKMEGIIQEFHMEYANRDSTELGVTESKRTGYGLLKTLAKYPFIAGVGVIDVHTDFIEPPELIRDRVLYAVDMMGDPNRVFVAPDCGLRTRTWEVAFQKLRNMVDGVEMAKSILGI